MSEPGKNALILMYHRVADADSDPFSLCVTPQHFSEHLEVLRNCARTVPLTELAAGIRNGGIPPRSVVLTFDDGYADNLENAKPALECQGIPATCFIATGPVDQQREFWWDELERIFLQPGRLPENLRLISQGLQQQWDLGASALYTETEFRKNRQWKAGSDAPTPRHSTFGSVWRMLQQIREPERRALLDQIRDWSGAVPAPGKGPRPLSLQELVAFSHGDLIEIGAHTVTHSVLPDLPAAAQSAEILQSKFRLEEILGFPVASFAYPYGALSDVSAATVANAGFACACSTVPASVDSTADLFRLPRFQVEDWDGDEFRRRIEEWLQTSSRGLWNGLRTDSDPGRAAQGGPWLRAANGNRARLMVPPGDPHGFRIVIDTAVTEEASDIQLNFPASKVRVQHRYAIHFLARADRMRSACVGFSQSHEPWTGLGLYKRIDLKPEWQSFREEFQAAASDDNARIHFDLGGSGISVDLSSIGFVRASDPESSGETEPPLDLGGIITK